MHDFKFEVIMKNLLMFFYIVLFSISVQSAEWVSPIDKKYIAKDPVNFADFDKARDILNSWRGQGEKLRKADVLLKKVLAKDSDFAPAYREYGRLYIMAGHINYDNFKQGSLNPSEAAINRSLEIEPEYADSYVLLGHLYTKMKRYKDAEDALKKAESIGTEIPWLDLNWAGVLEKKRKYKEAMHRYEKVVNSGTVNTKAYAVALSGKTTMHMYMGQFSKANDGYKKEIENEPDSAWNWSNYAEFLLFRYDDVDGAIKHGREALKRMNFGAGRFLLGSALYTKWAQLKIEGDKDVLAQEYFDQAWSIYPYPEQVINKAKRHGYTQQTAQELQKWLLINKNKEASNRR